MTARRRRARQPMAAWFDLALKTGEMLAASAQVIAQRTQRMAKAGPRPGARDRREFTRMGVEKIDAARDSAQAVATHLFGLGLAAQQRALRQWWSGANAAALASVRLADTALMPVRSRAVANSKRLRRR